MRSQKGFTLIEVVVVLSIMGIISLFAIPNIAGYIEVNNERYRVNQEQLINKTLIQYYALTGEYYSAAYNASGYIANVPNMYNELNSKAGSLLDSSVGNYRYKLISGTPDPSDPDDPLDDTDGYRMFTEKIVVERIP